MRSLAAAGVAAAALSLVAGAGGGDLAAVGTIDVTDASITVGEAPVAGAITIDDAASLGNLPVLERPSKQWSQYFDRSRYEERPEAAHDGLGGPAFRAQVDLTMPGGTYDYGSFTVDRGVVVRFTGPVTIRATNEIRVDGRIEMEGAGLLALDCLGDLTVVGHDEPVATGLVALDDGGRISLAAGGVLGVGADEGAQVQIEAKGVGGSVRIVSDRDDPSIETTVAHAVIEASPDGELVVSAANGFVRLTDCVTKGPVARVVVESHRVPEDLDEDGFAESLVVSGGAFEGLDVWTHWDATFESQVQVRGAYAAVFSHQGRIFLGEGTSIVTRRDVQMAGSAVDVGEDAEVRTTGEEAGFDMVLAAGWNSPIGVRIGAGTVVEHRSGAELHLSGARGVEVHGTVRGHGRLTALDSSEGDVLVADDADVDSPEGTLRMWAAGAVVAEGGQATLTARDFDVRCVTGDLDLDVEAVDATGGRFLAMSNGQVRLRGAFGASGDVQVISLADAIDVSGVVCATEDAGAAPSGFVRLATYAATSIDASGAALSTGGSDAQSGDVLIQVEAEGTEVLEGVMKVQRATVKRMPDGVHTVLSGTMSVAGLASAQLGGTARVQVGGTSHRVFLRGGDSKLAGERPGVSLRIARTGRSRAKFVLDMKESVTKEPGEVDDIRFVRAGVRANGKFRRPKPKK